MEVAIENSFAEYSLFYMALLQKRPVNLRSLLIVEVAIENSQKSALYLFYSSIFVSRFV